MDKNMAGVFNIIALPNPSIQQGRDSSTCYRPIRSLKYYMAVKIMGKTGSDPQARPPGMAPGSDPGASAVYQSVLH